MEPQIPAKGILLQKEFKDSKVYTVACDCGDPAHGVTMWIESNAEIDTDDINLTFYVETVSPWWNLGRLKQIWQIITTGYLKQEATVILSKQGALNLSTVIRNTVKELEQK